jgi:hypothetical protein
MQRSTPHTLVNKCKRKKRKYKNEAYQIEGMFFGGKDAKSANCQVCCPPRDCINIGKYKQKYWKVTFMQITTLKKW